MNVICAKSDDRYISLCTDKSKKKLSGSATKAFFLELLPPFSGRTTAASLRATEKKITLCPRSLDAFDTIYYRSYYKMQDLYNDIQCLKKQKCFSASFFSPLPKFCASNMGNYCKLFM